ncbi:MAG: SdrD B-like domain-containing protein [Anaerolineae bacterium]
MRPFGKVMSAANRARRHLTAVAIVVSLSTFFIINLTQAQGSPGSHCAPNCALVGDLVWEDLDDDGRQEDGETGLAGVTVELYLSNSEGDLASSAPQYTTVTNSAGLYQIEPQMYHWYRLRFVPNSNTSPGMAFSPQFVQDVPETKDSDPFEIGDEYEGYSIQFYLDEEFDFSKRWDAGLSDPEPPACGPWTLGDTIWIDNNNDGIYQSTTDNPAIGIPVDLYRVESGHANGAVPIGATRTNSGGQYSFSCLKDEEEYFITLPRIAGYVVAPQSVSNPNSPHSPTDNNLLSTSPFPDATGLVDAATNPILLPEVSSNSVDDTLDGALSCRTAPVDFVFVIDKSGSMSGKLEDAKAAALSILQTAEDEGGGTSSGDISPRRGGVVWFSTSADSPAPVGLTNDKRDLDAAINAVNEIHVGGSTDIAAGLEAAATMLRAADPDSINGTIILLTDGYNTAGDLPVVSKAGLLKGFGHRIVVVGFGEVVNEVLLKRVATSPSDYYFDRDATHFVEIFDALYARLCDRPAWGDFMCTDAGSLNIDISTGRSPGGTIPNPIPSDTEDYSWKVVNGITETLSAYLVPAWQSWPTYWGRRLQGSTWISDSPSAESTTQGAIHTYHTNVFITGRRVPERVELKAWSWVDDTIQSVKLKNSEHPSGTDVTFSSNGYFGSQPAELTLADPDAFALGDNFLEVKVKDDNGVKVGLDLTGQVAACDKPHVDVEQTCIADSLDGRRMAVKYALQYALSRNDCWPSFGGGADGSDCQNFVSQCIYASGVDMDCPNWYWFENGQHSPSWINVELFVDAAVAAGITSVQDPIGVHGNFVDNRGNSILRHVQIGDLVLYRWERRNVRQMLRHYKYSHVAIVTNRYGDHTEQTQCENGCTPIAQQVGLNGTLVTAHTSDRRNVLWNVEWSEPQGQQDPKWRRIRFWHLPMRYTTTCRTGRICPPVDECEEWEGEPE